MVLFKRQKDYLLTLIEPNREPDAILVTRNGKVFTHQLVLFSLLPWARDLPCSSCLNSHMDLVIFLPDLECGEVEEAVKMAYRTGSGEVLGKLIAVGFEPDDESSNETLAEISGNALEDVIKRESPEEYAEVSGQHIDQDSELISNLDNIVIVKDEYGFFENIKEEGFTDKDIDGIDEALNNIGEDCLTKDEEKSGIGENGEKFQESRSRKVKKNIGGKKNKWRQRSWSMSSSSSGSRSRSRSKTRSKPMRQVSQDIPNMSEASMLDSGRSTETQERSPIEISLASPLLKFTQQPSPAFLPQEEEAPHELDILYSLDDSPVRRRWLDKYLEHQARLGRPLTQCPTVRGNPLDLYALFLAVEAEGGFLFCTENKRWKKVASKLSAFTGAPWNLPHKIYKKYLYNFETACGQFSFMRKVKHGWRGKGKFN